MTHTIIKVYIGLRPSGEADHPNWYALPLATLSAAEEEDWARLWPDNPKEAEPFRVKKHALISPEQRGGWVYDKQAGHKQNDPGADWPSPYGMQWGCMVVTELFAAEAVATFPATISRITEAEFEVFFNTRSRGAMPEFKRESEELVSLDVERNLRERKGENLRDIDAQIARALDPDDPTPGVRRRINRFWALQKAEWGVSIIVDP